MPFKYHALFKTATYRHPVDETIFEEPVRYEFGVLRSIKVGIPNAIIVIGDELSVMTCVRSSIQEEPRVDLLWSLREDVQGPMDAPKGTSRAVAPKVVIANTRACLADSITGKRFQRCCPRYKNVGGIVIL